MGRRGLLWIVVASVALAATGLAGGAAHEPARVLVEAPTTLPEPADLVLADPEGRLVASLTPGGLRDQADAQASWSPDGTKIAFVSNRDRTTVGAMTTVYSELYVMNADGTDQRRITVSGNVDRGVSSPAWSPAGRLIAFQRSDGVYVIAPDGSGERLVAAGRLVEWAPDGSALLVVAGPPLAATLNAVHPGGGVRRVLVAMPAIGGAAWSPDGSRVAFAGSRLLAGQRLERPRLWVVGAHGGEPRPLSERLVTERPAWSPDGSELAFAATLFDAAGATRFGFRTFTDVYVVRADGRAERRVTGIGSPDSEWELEAAPLPQQRSAEPPSTAPSWWPDGSRLFFISSLDGRRAGSAAVGGPALFMVNADGSCETPFPVRGVRAAWRPGSRPGLPPLRCIDLSVRASASVERLGLGQPAVLSFTVANDGDEPAPAVRLAVRLGTGIDAVRASGARCRLGALVSCRLAVAPGAASTVRLAVRGAGVRDAVSTTRAVVSGRRADTNPLFDRAVLRVRVLPCARFGTAGPDRLVGTARRDRLCGLAGRDRISGLGGDDVIDGGLSADRLSGGARYDSIVGGPGQDRVAAGAGGDVVDLRDGERDVVRCGPGVDRVRADPLDVVAGDCEGVRRRWRSGSVPPARNSVLRGHVGSLYSAAAMAVPKRKTSKARRDKRRAQHAITPPRVNECPTCHRPKRPHHVCPNCRTYKGREVEPLRLEAP